MRTRRIVGFCDRVAFVGGLVGSGERLMMGGDVPVVIERQ